MIIDTSKPRSHYFKQPTEAAMLATVTGKDRGNTWNDIREAHAKGSIVFGNEGGLDQLLNDPFSANPLRLVQIIDNLDPDQLCIIPAQFRITKPEAREEMAYDVANLVKLDTAPVRRAVLGEDAPPDRLTEAQKRELGWSPERVLSAAFELLHQNHQRAAAMPLSCYSWVGSDGHRRVVSLEGSIRAPMLTVFQDYAAFKLNLPIEKQELRTGTDSETGLPLSDEKRRRLERSVRESDRVIERRGLAPYLARLDVTEDDLIPVKPAGKRMDVWEATVPSQKTDSRTPPTYGVTLTKVPVLAPGNPWANSVVWNMNSYGGTLAKRYNQNRRTNPLEGQDDTFFDTATIAACHAIRAYVRKRVPGKVLGELPFVIPTEDMVSFYHNLFYSTLMVEQGQTPGRRTLNHAEMQSLLWKRILVHGYSPNCTTDPRLFEKRANPRGYLLQLK